MRGVKRRKYGGIGTLIKLKTQRKFWEEKYGIGK